MLWGVQVWSKEVCCLVYLITVMCVNCLGDGRCIAWAGTRIMSRWGLQVYRLSSGIGRWRQIKPGEIRRIDIGDMANVEVL